MDKKKSIKTRKLKIEKNTISFNRALVQISNISSVNVEPVPKPKVQWWFITMCAMGVPLILLYKGEIRYVGFLLFTAGITYVIWYILVNINNEDSYLCIHLNSGDVYYIYCADKNFLKQVMKVIKFCFNDKMIQQNIMIDFDNCKFNRSPINIRNKKEVFNALIEGNSFVINNWKLIQDELRRACESLPESSEEYAASEEALGCALEEDEDGLIETFHKYAGSFLSDVFSGVVSGVFVELVKAALFDLPL